MVSDEDIIEEQEEERDYLDLPLCSRCNGSGEGTYDGSRCTSCNGSGEQKPKIDESW
jgi:DnaJ-class molecular chaperone